MSRSNTVESIHARLNKHGPVSVPALGECWVWEGRICGGYGYLSFQGRDRSVHKLLYESEHGPVPEELELDHLCRTRNCARTSHLEAVAHQVNIARGDTGKVRFPRTVCRNGHNTKEGERCKQCARDRSRRYRSQLKCRKSATST